MKELVRMLSREDFNKELPQAWDKFMKLNPKLFSRKKDSVFLPRDPNAYTFFSYMDEQGNTVKLICNDRPNDFSGPNVPLSGTKTTAVSVRSKNTEGSGFNRSSKKIKKRNKGASKRGNYPFS